jgi:hypothetical protein
LQPCLTTLTGIQGLMELSDINHSATRYANNFRSFRA